MKRNTLCLLPRAVRAVAAIGCSLLPVFMNAQLDRTKPPVAGPAPEVHLGDHVTTELPNGMHLIVVEDHKLPLVSVQVRFDVPPIVQHVRAGYIDMVGELIMAGTITRAKADIDKAIDALGADLSATNDGVYGSALKRNLGPLMDLVQDVVQNPTFPAEELEKTRTRFRSSVQQRNEDPESLAEVIGRKVTFGRMHPYGEMMTLRTIAAIDRAAIAAYHRYFFRPEKAYLVFVGDITEKEARDLAKKHFGKWRPAPALMTTDEHGNVDVEGLGVIRPLQRPVTAGGSRRVFMVDRPGAAQSVIRVSFPLSLLPKDLRAQGSQVMNTILGGGIFNARLMQNLREKRGFTYGAYSSLDVDRFNSSFTASVSVRTEVTDSAVAEIMKELERMRSEPVTREELELAKKSMMGSFGRSLENSRTVARFALNTELNELAPDHYRTYLTRLESITAQQVQDAGAAFLYPDQASILVVGDMDRVAEGLVQFTMGANSPVVRLDEEGEPWQEQITPVRDRTAQQVIDAYITAIGGRDAIARIKHLKVEHNIAMSGGSLTNTRWSSGDQYRSVVKNDGALEEETIFDGQRVQFTTPEVVGELTDAAYELTRLEALPVPEVAYGELLDKMLLVGSTPVRGRTTYKVVLMTLSGTSFADYFDAETGLKVQRTRTELHDERTFDITTEYSNLRPIKGVLFPFTITERGGPSGKVERTITSVEVDKAMPAAFFATNIPEPPETPNLPEPGTPIEDE